MGYSIAMSSILKHSNDDDGNGDGEYTQRPFGKALRQLRKRRGLTQGELAALVGAAGHSTVATWEVRAEPIDDDEMMERLSTVLGVSVDWLAEGKVPTERAAARAFDDAVEELAGAYLSGESLRLAVTMWKAAQLLADEDKAALGRIVEAMATQERVRREGGSGSEGQGVGQG